MSGTPSLAALATSALNVVARDGVPVEAAANTDEAGWQVLTDDATRLDVSLAGPDIPEGIVEGHRAARPDRRAAPEEGRL